MISFLNNSIASSMSQYGPLPVVGVAFTVGLIYIPVLKKVVNFAIQFFKTMGDFINKYTLAIQVRSLGCPTCALTHRAHIAGTHTAAP